MIMVGILTGVGLALIGVPSALALGLIAGVTEFVPIIGPVLGSIPALLLASTQDWHTVLWTLALFVAVQQIESNLIMPLVAGRVVAVRPRSACSRWSRSACCSVRSACCSAIRLRS
jgi:predicted PurR-regulated permease PerM